MARRIGLQDDCICIYGDESYNTARADRVGVRGTQTITTDADVRNVQPDTSLDFMLPLDFRELPGGHYDVEVGLFWNHTPVRFGLKDETRDGYYRIAET